MSNEQMKTNINGWGHVRWRMELDSKSSLELYKDNTPQIAEDKMYANRYRSVLMFRCRTNTLKFGWRNRVVGGEVEYESCGGGEETLQHFLRDCERLQRVRVKHRVKDILLFRGSTEGGAERYMGYVEEFWRRRGGLLRSAL